jgi:hypothetical protein
MQRSRHSDSNSDTESLRSSVSGYGGFRIDVVVAEGSTLAVPVTESTTFANLQAEALRRAARLNIEVPQEDLILRLDSKDGPVAFPEDIVIDILDVPSRPGVYLRSRSSQPVSLRTSATLGC